MDAFREYKPEILEAHRHGLNVHRIAEIFKERGVASETGSSVKPKTLRRITYIRTPQSESLALTTG
jgi:hypothetical protein